MGRITKLLSFSRVERNGAKISDVKIDPGGGHNITAEHFAPAGDDSFPLKSDYVVTNDILRAGGEAAIGYLDSINTPKALEGDKRIYARDANTGAVIIEIWLKNDGTGILSNANGSFTLNPDGSIKGDNGSGSFELQAGGDFVVNGVTIDTNGNITSPATVTAAVVSAPSILANGKDVADHNHAITSGSSAPGPTGNNN